ncbi:MAG TPA: DNA primase [Terriglobia bacterium]|nr:DNA primase [Terriglobia bacterium]
MKPSEQVRAAVDIVKIVGDYVKLRKAGANMVGLCPFHQEKTPSFAVHSTKQIFHCFGCGAGGDVFKFVMLIENLSFPEALHRVAEKAGIKIEANWSEATHDPHAHERTVLLKMHEIAAQYYAEQMAGTAEGRAARGYLADRGMEDKTVGLFRLGYAPAGGSGLVLRLKEAGFSGEVLEKCGLFTRSQDSSGLMDRFRRRVIFPIAQENGKVVAFAGRALGDDQPKYLNSPETPIYIKSRLLYGLDRAGNAIRKQEFAILVEGYMDAISLVAGGVQNVVASCGTSLTEAQVRLLGRFARRVVVNYDPDSAGVAATERSLNMLLEEGFEVRVLELPDGLDPDSFIGKNGTESYQKLLDRAPGYIDYVADRAASRVDVRSPHGKVAVVNNVLPYIARVPNPILRLELAARLAQRLQIEDKLLRDELRRVARGTRGEREAKIEAPTVQPTAVERWLLRCILEIPGCAAEYLPELAMGGLTEGLAMQHLFASLNAQITEAAQLDLAGIEGVLGAEERRWISDAQFCKEQAPPTEDSAKMIETLRLRKVKRDLQALDLEIEQGEAQGDTSLVAELRARKLLLRRPFTKIDTRSKNL